VHALFRMREGDPDTALKLFDSGDLPRDTHGPLVLDLEARLSKVHGELSAKVQQREAQAQQEFNLIQRERTRSRDGADRVKRINDLLTQYGDTEFVREHEGELREMKSQIAQAGKLSLEDRLRAAYGQEISFPGNSRASLEYLCGSEPSARWEMGDWLRSAGGWSADRKHSRQELENETLWPRLELEDPLDLNAPMRVEIEFEEPQGSGPPLRFIASVAGVHLGFAGPTDLGLKSQFAAKAGGVEAMKEMLEVLDKQRGTPIGGLERGKSYKLRVDLGQNRGRLSARLNNEDLPGGDYLRPEGRGSSYSIVVRSMEPVMLRSVHIEAGVRK
jgi:hypothetical protein